MANRFSKHDGEGYFKDGEYIPLGRYQRPRSPFCDLRLKRFPRYWKRKKEGTPSFIQVQKRNIEDRWVSLGDYDTENEAVEVLEFEAELMNRISERNHDED